MSKVFGIGTCICYNEGIIKWVKILSIGVSELVSVPVLVPVSVLGDFFFLLPVSLPAHFMIQGQY